MRELRAVLQRAVIAGDLDFLDAPVQADAAEDGHGTCADCAGHALNAARCRRIREAWRLSEGNIAVVARRLGISRTTVYKHLR
jgi:transcriptional regulator of acetoin/glycerol metabolism